MRIRLTIGYVGTSYAGWQRQKQTDTVQGRVEDAIRAVDPSAGGVCASGRTDAGVHALGQSAHFDTAAVLSDEAWRSAINCHLPPDIRIVCAKRMPDSFHARRDAVKKTYHYRMYYGPAACAEYFDRAVYIGAAVDVDAMRTAAAHFIGTHDFKAFQSAGGSVKTTVRTVYAANVIQKPGRQLVFAVSASGFLYNMVRRMAAALIFAGQGRLNPATIASAFDNPSAYMVHYVAPAHGLYLHSVSYDARDRVEKSTEET